MGSIERNHRVLNEYLHFYISNNYDNWDEYLKYFTYCYNITPHSSFNFKYCPFELVFGKTPIPYDFLLDVKIDPFYNFDEYAKKVKFHLQTTSKLAREHLIATKEACKTKYDEKVKPLNLGKEDKILLRNEARNKLDLLYSGPHRIKNIHNPNATIIL